ncbi:MAG: LexA family transcriptional regulator [Taibaiella sp.]|nr:LexA family transcriptional regulator [Taibaiella sp.]
MSLPKNLKFLRKKRGKTQDGLGTELGIGRTTLANYEAGISEPNVENLLTFSNYYGVSVDDLLSKNLEQLIGANDPAGFTGRGLPADKFNGIPRIITVDQKGNDNIVYVPVKARAGYLLGYGDSEFMETLPTFRLPGLSNATYRMFEVEGPSMAPNVLHGDKLIGEWVDNLDKVRDNRVYIIVHKGGVAVKRVINRIQERGKLYLKSDTIAHRHEFPTLEIEPDDIKEIWYGRLKISSDFTEPAEVYHRIANLETDVMELKRVLKGDA